MISQNQKTLNGTIKFNGVGLHNGVSANLTVKPAKENFGIRFCRTDIDKENLIEANYQNVVEPILCTKIRNSNGTTVSTVEHLMAAFFGEGIDNALVEIDASEVPILDGSAIEFVEAIRAAGIKDQKEVRKFIKVKKKVEIQDNDKYMTIEPLDNDLIVDFEIIYQNPLIRTRRKEFKLSDGNLTNIYNSRTFCLYEDIDFIKSQGLAKGGSLENAVVVKENEILNDDGLRNRHEFVYHKILDCLGDLMLSGHRMFGHVKTSQGGHALTNKLLIKFFSDKSNWSLESSNIVEKNNKIKESSKKTLSTNI
jgi:UDP-3-O-[3-hydroxymyristoyl] N-acetylglucosamine deacetylase